MEMKKMELETEIKQMEAKGDDILILGIESSCDETAASVVRNGRTVLSNVISSQIDLHTLYGGVVPEIASRKHIERINQVVTQALTDADVTLDDMTAIAVTYGPGLVGALLVGVAEAKAIALQRTSHLSVCITSKDISAPILLNIKNWSRRLPALWYRADIRILLS